MYANRGPEYIHILYIDIYRERDIDMYNIYIYIHVWNDLVILMCICIYIYIYIYMLIGVLTCFSSLRRQKERERWIHCGSRRSGQWIHYGRGGNNEFTDLFSSLRQQKEREQRIRHACGKGAGRCPAQPEQAARRELVPCACRSQQQRGRNPVMGIHYRGVQWEGRCSGLG